MAEGETEPSKNRNVRVRFSANADPLSENEEQHNDTRNRRLLRYWYKGGRRYSEAERAFLSRVRIPAVGGDGDGKMRWFGFFDPGG